MHSPGVTAALKEGRVDLGGVCQDALAASARSPSPRGLDAKESNQVLRRTRGLCESSADLSPDPRMQRPFEPWRGSDTVAGLLSPPRPRPRNSLNNCPSNFLGGKEAWKHKLLVEPEDTGGSKGCLDKSLHAQRRRLRSQDASFDGMVLLDPTPRTQIKVFRGSRHYRSSSPLKHYSDHHEEEELRAMKGRFITDGGKVMGSKRLNFEDPTREQASAAEPPLLSDERGLASPGPMTYVSAPHGQGFETLRRVGGRRSVSLEAARNLQESEEKMYFARSAAAVELAREAEATVAAGVAACVADAVGGSDAVDNSTTTNPPGDTSPEPAGPAAAGIESARLDGLNMESRRRFDFNELEAQLAPDFLAGRFTWSPRSIRKKRSNGRGHWTDVVTPELLPTAVLAPTPPATLHQLPHSRNSAVQRQQHSPSRQRVTVCTHIDRGTGEVWLDDPGSNRMNIFVEPPRKAHMPHSEATTRAPTAQPSANHSPVTTPRSRTSPKICHRNVEADLGMAKASPLPPQIPMTFPILLGATRTHAGEQEQPMAFAVGVQPQQPIRKVTRPTSARASCRKWRP
mmetsp:Transcript_49948/g.99144  ORF Transcript_49948/g.99144 Transcript_49948/m.99144 type:complete len:571 (+) Transcript_49948:92-1804(+)